MAKISTYSPDYSISVDDKLIGTDAENSNVTKNYLVGDLLDFFENSAGFVPYTGATDNVNLGTYNLFADYIEGTNEIYSPILGGDNVDVYQELRISQNAVIKLDGDEGNIGDIIISQGIGNTPTWESRFNYLQAFSLVTQQCVAVSTPKTVEFEVSSFSNDVTTTSNQISFVNAGKYKIEVNARVQHTSGGGDAELSFWLKYASLNVDNSRQVYTVANTHVQEISYSFVVDIVNPADVILVQWTTTNLAAQLIPTVAATFYPAAPSVVLNIYRVG